MRKNLQLSFLFSFRLIKDFRGEEDSARTSEAAIPLTSPALVELDAPPPRKITLGPFQVDPKGKLDFSIIQNMSFIVGIETYLKPENLNSNERKTAFKNLAK